MHSGYYPRTRVNDLGPPRGGLSPGAAAPPLISRSHFSARAFMMLRREARPSPRLVALEGAERDDNAASSLSAILTSYHTVPPQRTISRIGMGVLPPGT